MQVNNDIKDTAKRYLEVVDIKKSIETYKTLVDKLILLNFNGLEKNIINKLRAIANNQKLNTDTNYMLAIILNS